MIKNIFILTILKIYLFAENNEIKILKKEIEIQRKELALAKLKINQSSTLQKAKIDNFDNYKFGLSPFSFGYGVNLSFEYYLADKFSIGGTYEYFSTDEDDFIFRSSQFYGNEYGIISKYYFNQFDSDSPYFNPLLRYTSLNIKSSDFMGFNSNKSAKAMIITYGVMLGYQWIWDFVYIQVGIGGASYYVDSNNKNDFDISFGPIIGDLTIGVTF